PYQNTTILLHKQVKIASMSKCPPYQNTTILLHKQVKIASISKCPPYQNTTLLLHKHVKIASISKCPPYQKHYTFSMQTCHNCVLMQMSTISNDYTSFQDHMPVSTISNTTHFLYKHVKIASLSYKCPPYQSLHTFHASVHYIKNCTFP